MNFIQPFTPSSWRFLGPVIVAGLFHCLIIQLYLMTMGGDHSALVCASEERIGQGPLHAIHRGFKHPGHDGAYYYIIAQNPFSPEQDFIDVPCYRRTRFFYPAISWLLSGGGDAVRLLWVMPLLNLTATLGLAWFGVLFAVQYRRSHWWGLVLPIAMNVIPSSMRNLTDPLSALAAVGLLSSWIMRWPVWLTIGWGIAAVLSREQNLAIVGVLLAATLIAKDYGRFAGLLTVCAIEAGWIGVLYSIYGQLPKNPEAITLPFRGIIHGWTHLGEILQGHRDYVRPLIFLSIMTAQMVVCSIAFFRGDRLIRCLALAAVGLALVAGPAVYFDRFDYSRVLNWVPMVVWLWTVQSNRRWPIFVLAPGVLYPLLGIKYPILITNLRTWMAG
ncbi:MAG: hypothetical protein K8T89_13640 [Planctomycetes bacterium]|nr:hypothetical protein [Planctomycetota bacterium]